MFTLRRKKPVPSKPAATERLDQVRAEIAAILRDANERIEKMLERGRARESTKEAR